MHSMKSPSGSVVIALVSPAVPICFDVVSFLVKAKPPPDELHISMIVGEGLWKMRGGKESGLTHDVEIY